MAADASPTYSRSPSLLNKTQVVRAVALIQVSKRTHPQETCDGVWLVGGGEGRSADPELPGFPHFAHK